MVSAAPQTSQEYTLGSGASLGTYPVDSAATHNNNRAAVRYANPTSNAVILSVWQLTGAGLPSAPLAQFGGTVGGTPLMSGYQTDPQSPLYGYMPSDRIEMTNARCVSIGSGLSGLSTQYQDETYIEVFDVSTTPPSFQTQFVITPTVAGWNHDHAGYANDVAITRDGTWAVVNSDNWIHVINLPNAAIASAFNIGDVDYSQNPPAPGWNRPCTPNQAVDSVAVTNDVAVVTTARIDPASGRFRTWVYIVDLSTVPAQIVLQDQIIPHITLGEEGDRPHDVDISIDVSGTGLFAWVTTTHGVAVYDLSTNTPFGQSFDANDLRRYQWQVDSVEVADKVAIVLADNTSSGTTHWKVTAFSTSLPGGLTALATYSPNTAAPESRAHDLALDKTLDKAIVRTSFDNVVITSVSNPPPMATVLPSLNGSNAHEYKTFNSNTGYPVFSSDSAAIAPDLEGRIIAVTIGGYVNSTIGKWQGAVDLIDLAASPLTVMQVGIAPDPGDIDYGCLPLDLAIAFNHGEVVVRSVDNYFQSTSTGESDLVRISLAPPVGFAARYGGHGTLMGLDSLAAPFGGFVNTTKRVLSVSQDPFASGNDYVHIAH